MKNLALLLLACAPAWALAQADPLKSAACGDALAALQHARSQGEPVEGPRSRAQLACLGVSPPPGRSARVLQAPVQVPPPAISVPAVPPPLPAVSLPPPPVTLERPPTPSVCDVTGCWANDGQHLQHLAPNLAGPGGQCSQQGGLVYCP